MSKSNTGRKQWKPKFLAVYQQTGCVADSAAAAGISRTTAYEAQATDETFREAVQAIKHDWVTRLEERGIERALQGSDRLMEFFLKALKPNTYRDSLKIDGKISIASEAELNTEIEEFLARRREELESAGEGETAGPAGLRGVGGADRQPSAAPPR